MTDVLTNLADDIETAMGKGHRGYTIYGAQMDWVVQALRVLSEANTPSAKRPAPIVETSMPNPYAQP